MFWVVDEVGSDSLLIHQIGHGSNYTGRWHSSCGDAMQSAMKEADLSNLRVYILRPTTGELERLRQAVLA